MRVSMNWLKEYLDLRDDVGIDKICEVLNLAGLEVEGVEDISAMSSKIKLGRVENIDRALEEGRWHYFVRSCHQEKLMINGSSYSSISPGMVVGYKKVGGDGAWELADFQDLGLAAGAGMPIAFAEHDIEEIPDNLASIREFDDVVIALGITPNRADALNHLGVARELSALMDLGLRLPSFSPKEMARPTHEKVAIEVEDPKDCPRYACRLIENVSITESPYWMKLRLIEAGVRPINNVVDVTNYVMLSLGQPMHAFDYNKLVRGNGRVKIDVRRALPDEKFVALDGKEVSLCSDDLVVADGDEVIALAGVIGGLNSSVSRESNYILLESANFDAKLVRLSARRNFISTESSYRFERGCDPNAVVDALNYAAYLLVNGSEARCSREPIDVYRWRIEPQEIKLRPERAQAILGMADKDFDQDLVRRRFLRLGIETMGKRDDAIYFRVPTYRSDLAREIDLIEEALRVLGYDKIKDLEGPLGSLGGEKFTSVVQQRIRATVDRLMVARGFFEVTNYAFINKEFQGRFQKPEQMAKVIDVKNPLSDRYDSMRISLIPGLIKNLVHNQRAQERSIHLYEFGTVFLGRRNIGQSPNPSRLTESLEEDSYCLEKVQMAGVMAGFSAYEAFDQPRRPLDFYHIKGAVSEIFSALGMSDAPVTGNIYFEHGCDSIFFHPGESCRIFARDGRAGAPILLGALGKLHPAVAQSCDVLGHAFIFELDVDLLGKVVSDVPRYQPFSRFPGIDRDIAFVMDEEIPVEEILRTAYAVEGASEKLAKIRIFDIYRGKNIDEGKKSVAVSLTLQRQDRTLTDDEADVFIDTYIDLVREKSRAIVR